MENKYSQKTSGIKYLKKLAREERMDELADYLIDNNVEKKVFRTLANSLSIKNLEDLKMGVFARKFLISR